MESGINADILVCRTEHDISKEIKNKLALFCNVDVDSVIQSKDAFNNLRRSLNDGTRKIRYSCFKKT